jgi:hypothetical protein
MSSGLIKAGYEYYEESKQTVEMSRDATEPADVEIMSADDVAPFWFVRLAALAAWHYIFDGAGSGDRGVCGWSAAARHRLPAGLARISHTISA